MAAHFLIILICYKREPGELNVIKKITGGLSKIFQKIWGKECLHVALPLVP